MDISVFLQKTFARPRAVVNQAGQAVVEYILLLVIVVGIILGILYQFNTAFKTVLNSYFKDYIGCLLETGELPSLGGEGLGSGECNSQFKNFSLSNGRPLVEDSGASGPTSSGGGQQTSLSGGAHSGSGSGSGGPTSSVGGAGNSSSGGGRNTSSGPISGNNKNSETSRNNGGRPAVQSLNTSKNGATSSSSTESAGDGGFSSGRGRRVRKRTVYLDDDYSTAEDKKTKLVGRKNRAPRTKLKEGGLSSLRKPVMPLKIPEPRAPSSDIEEGMDFSFGMFIKFLLIGGILIALFIFLGGQALQIKKSWQKSE